MPRQRLGRGHSVTLQVIVAPEVARRLEVMQRRMYPSMSAFLRDVAQALAENRVALKEGENYEVLRETIRRGSGTKSKVS